MAFQTNVLENGAWVSKTVDIKTLFSRDESSSGAAAHARVAPVCGILRRTVVDSPAVNLILPVRLRSSSRNDVAFIFDHHVEIKEYRNGRLHHVAKKIEFEQIKNAGVVGSFFEDSATRDLDASGPGPRPARTFDSYQDLDDTDFARLQGPPQESTLPPQLLVLALGLGRFVFVFLAQDARGREEFVCSYVNEPATLPEAHYEGPLQLAVDPSGRYMAMSSSSDHLFIYQLHPPQNLQDQYRASGTIQPVFYVRPREVSGRVYKVVFLFPRPEDDETVILAFIVVRRDGGGSRLVTYDWEFDEDLRGVFNRPDQGFPLPSNHQLPLLLIPLTVNSSLLSVSEQTFAVFPNMLQGPGVPEIVDPPTQDLHSSEIAPIWAAWARPLRRRDFLNSSDHVYLTREDGSITFLELNSAGVLDTSMELAQTKTSISTAFGVLGAPSGSDVLIIGGSCGRGTIWECKARETPEKPVGIIPNWAPASDFAATDQFLTWSQPFGFGDCRDAMIPWEKQAQNGHDMAKYDRIFSSAGHVGEGSIMEYRRGVSAPITLDIDLESPLTKLWAFPEPGGLGRGLKVLLSLHQESIVLQIPASDIYGTIDASEDALGVRELEAEESGFDKSCRTLAAVSLRSDQVCQVTETAIVIVGPTQSSRHAIDQILGVPGFQRAENACIRGELIGLSVLMQPSIGFQIYIISNLDTVLRCHDIKRETTCIEFCSVGDQRYVVAALWEVNQTSLCLYPVDFSISNGPTLEVAVELESSQPLSTIDAITSLAVVHESAGKTVVAGGTRGGFLAVFEILCHEGSIQAAHRVERYGDSPIEVVLSRAGAGALFACWETGLVRLEDYDLDSDKGFRQRQRVLPVDPDPANLELHKLNSVAPLQPLLLMASGSRLLVTWPREEAELIPRQIPLDRTPQRMIYWHGLKCLVVAVSTPNGEPTLMFVDPDRGVLPCRASQSSGRAREFIQGLGQRGDRVHALREWMYEKDGSRFSWLLVGTQKGMLLVVSAVWEDQEIRYWTRLTLGPYEHPVSSLYADGENLFYSSGSTVHWDYLDTGNRKIQMRATIEASVPVRCINVRDGKLLVLTQEDSMQVMDLGVVPEEGHVSLSDHGYLEPGKRMALHMIDVGASEGGDVGWPITLVSDMSKLVAGLWLPEGSPGKQLAVLFEAASSARIVRFCRAHTRPSWWRGNSRPRYGRIPCTVDDAEVFGLARNGSMDHFTLLDRHAWRFLQLFCEMARSEPDLIMRGYPKRETKLRPDQESPMEDPSFEGQGACVDGDLLRLIMDKKVVGELLAAAGPQSGECLRESLDALDGGRWTAGFRDDDSTMDEKYMKLAYGVMEYFLSPVF